MAEEWKSEPKLTVSQEFSVLQPRPQKAYLIAEADWRRIRRIVKEIVPPRNIYQQISSGSVGVFGSSIFALVSLMVSSTPPPNWAWTVVICAVLTSLVASVAFYYVDLMQKQATVRTTDSVLYEMAEIEQGCGPTASDIASSARPSAEARGLNVLSAQYGADGYPWKDVTSILNGRIINARLQVPVTNEELGPDPVPNVKKKIKVQYVLNGKSCLITVPEGEELLISDS